MTTSKTALRGRHGKQTKKDEKGIDRFIDLAQAALEEADIEEERKGVIHEVVEALIAKSGAPLVKEVISEQLHSQDVIERIAENHEENQHSTESLKAPDDEILEIQESMRTYDTPELLALFSEYLWRLFRVLLLASLVGLVCHFLNV
ncbi:uncharacterized protein B0P05DRAFT_479711 [Gilbertella persicaria]|uniref:uncharacterized protein n=1 Tax=Gilbertella persicaria TaxID=101096 RepID=UPI00221FD8DD|nr:uncharacterized protein B0P05DRAFT_479711 [Gilbertella persicaria]KAI8053134.1 hypothetical protein B0P05DRAFT_479711 [Gilbertella persicaria]